MTSHQRFLRLSLEIFAFFLGFNCVCAGISINHRRSGDVLLDFAHYKQMILDTFGAGNEKEMKKYLAMFNILDTNADVTIDADEFFVFTNAIDTLNDLSWLNSEEQEKLRMAQKMHMTRQNRMKDFEKMDLNKDRMVDFDEYRTFIEEMQPNTVDEDQMESVFDLYDRNGDGFVSLEELF